MIRKLSTLALAALFFLGLGSAQAGTVTAGGFGSYDCTYPCTPTFQQLYRSSLFGAAPITIDSISNFANGGSYSGSWDLFVSTSNSVVGSISSTFADNRGADQQYFGSVSFAGTSLSLMDEVFFTGSFNYNPLAGDLLVEWVRTSPSASGGFQAASGTGDLSRVYSFSAGATTGYVSQDYGIATKFTWDSAPVPESGTFVLFCIGLVSLIAGRRANA